MRYGRHLVTAALPAVAALLVSAGCGGQGGSSDVAVDAEPVAVTSTEATPVVDEPEATPITESERAWLASLKRYQARFQRDFRRSVTITQASMARMARLYGGCARTLRKAGDPGRYAAAAAPAERACKRLTRAETLLETAMSVSDSGGSVLAGSREQAIRDRALSGVFEAAGNADYDLQRAVERAAAIKRAVAAGRGPALEPEEPAERTDRVRRNAL